MTNKKKHRTNQQHRPLMADVLIVGGGPAGLAAAISLAEKERQVIVVERSDGSNKRPGEMLVPDARYELSQLGVSEAVQKDVHYHCHGVLSYWGSAEPAETNFLFNPFGTGYVLDRVAFDRTLAQKAKMAGVHVIQPGMVSHCEFDESIGQWNIIIQSEDDRLKAQSSFLIEATGRKSFLTRRLGIERIKYDNLIGVIRTSHMEMPHQTSNRYAVQLMIETATHGWWYTVPAPHNQMVSVYFTDADLLDKTKPLVKFWENNLQKTLHTKSRLKNAIARDDIQIVAANTSIRSRRHGHHWLTIGDASASFDPLTGFGTWKALQSGLNGAKAVHLHLGGSRTALSTLSELTKADFDKYLTDRSYYYNLVRENSNSPFWARRISSPKIASL